MFARQLRIVEICILIWFVGYVQFSLTRKAFRAILCESDTNKYSLSCSNNTKINITDANYGRQTHDHCIYPGGDWADDNDHCYTPAFKKVVQKMCNGVSKCTVMCNINFCNKGTDPCPNTYKYVNITFTCNKDKPVKQKGKGNILGQLGQLG